jgi:four helix bundle protein
MEGHMGDMKSTFEDLEIWRLSRELRKTCSSLTKSLPPEEKFRLTDQLVRASRSVTANIAEGYGRYHYQENIQYCRHARGSLFEIIDHLYVALDEGYIQEELFAKLKSQTTGIIFKMNGYIRYLNQQKSLTT